MGFCVANDQACDVPVVGVREQLIAARALKRDLQIVRVVEVAIP